jgi:hypothetical protein
MLDLGKMIRKNWVEYLLILLTVILIFVLLSIIL